MLEEQLSMLCLLFFVGKILGCLHYIPWITSRFDDGKRYAFVLFP